MNRRITNVERRDYPCWAILEPAPDVKGKWVAHCLEFDTLAQADDPAAAFGLLLQSTNEIVLDDLRLGVDPLERRAPPDDEGWSLLRYVADHPFANRVSTIQEVLDKISEHKVDADQVVIVAQFFLRYQRSRPSAHLAPETAREMFFQARERSIAMAV
jgi:hypothetical protein